jgi:hypothetical protein
VVHTISIQPSRTANLDPHLALFIECGSGPEPDLVIIVLKSPKTEALFFFKV